LDHGPVTEVLEPVSTALSAHHTPVDHRALSILSYFHAVFPGPSTSEDARNLCATHWTPVSLIARAPYDVDWAAAFPGGLAIAAPGGEDVIPSEVARVLPGAVVALVAATFDTPSGPAAGTTEWGYVQGAQPSPPSSSHCVGLALVRGVCPRAPPAAVEPGAPGLPVEGARAQLLTPLPPTLLGAANCAVKGALELPLWGWLGTPQAAGGGDSVAGWPRVRVPFLRWPPDARRTDGVPSPAGAERRRVRRNLMRRGQL
jgi:polynucleotide 5'-hydroxyl-kinase GRC3/NOL9